MKFKIIILGLLCLSLASTKGYSQLYMTRSGFVGFYSATSVEAIKAENHQTYAVIAAGKKSLAFAVLLKGFIFPKELMQEHFNENYMGSDKYPKATFVGAYTGDVVPGKDGSYPVTIKGSLTMHGVTKAIEMPATLQVKGDRISGNATFPVVPEDYNVSIPSLVREKIQKSLKVTVQIDCDLKK